MYSGKNRTALLSQQLIGDAMMRLLNRLAFDQISISDLCREAEISRQTFYSLFDSKENVVIYELLSSHCYDPQACCSGMVSYQDFLRSWCRYVVDNRDILSILARNHIMHCLYDSQYLTFSGCSCFASRRSPAEQSYIADYLASALTSLARTYVARGGVDSLEDLQHMACMLFSGSYLPDLFS